MKESIRTIFGAIRFAPRALLPDKPLQSTAIRPPGRLRLQSTVRPWRSAVQLGGVFVRVTVKELRTMAAAMQIPGRSKARRKADLVRLIEKARKS